MSDTHELLVIITGSIVAVLYSLAFLLMVWQLLFGLLLLKRIRVAQLPRWTPKKDL